MAFQKGEIGVLVCVIVCCLFVVVCLLLYVV